MPGGGPRTVGFHLVMSTRRVVLGTLALVLLLGGGLSAPAAQATSQYGSVSGINGVLYDDCLAYPYRYDVQFVPADAKDSGLDVTLVGPDKTQAASDFVDSGVGAGTSTFTLCTQVNPYGTYTIRAVFQWHDGSNVLHTSRLDDAHFTLRKPHSRTTLGASTRRPAYGQVVRYRVTAYDERPTGFVRRAFAWVHLEQRRAGRWVRIKGGRAMTHDTGRIVIRLRYRDYHQRMKIRAVTEPTTRYTRSTSAPLRLW